MFEITSSELDDAVESYVSGQSVDQDALDRDMDKVLKAIKGSNKCMGALAAAKLHIATQGPGHIECGLNESVAAFFLLAVKVLEARQHAVKDIDELYRMFAVSEAKDANHG